MVVKILTRKNVLLQNSLADARSFAVVIIVLMLRGVFMKGIVGGVCHLVLVRVKGRRGGERSNE